MHAEGSTNFQMVVPDVSLAGPAQASKNAQKVKEDVVKG